MKYLYSALGLACAVLAVMAVLSLEARAQSMGAATELQPLLGSGGVKRLPVAPTINAAGRVDPDGKPGSTVSGKSIPAPVPAAPIRLASISPPWPLCTATRYGNWPDRVLWRRWVIAQQADGGRWVHACSYDRGTYL